jgi:hypothetical protein
MASFDPHLSVSLRPPFANHLHKYFISVLKYFLVVFDLDIDSGGSNRDPFRSQNTRMASKAAKGGDFSAPKVYVAVRVKPALTDKEQGRSSTYYSRGGQVR